MKVDVLGSSGGFPAPGEPCSGYLLRAADRAIWIDAGGGTLAELLRHCSLAELDAVWISHLHPDHCSDLVLAAHMVAVGGSPRQALLPVYGPQGWAARLDGHRGNTISMAEAFAVRELHDGDRVPLPGLELEAIAVRHDGETFGLRASAGGSTVAYTADSGPCPALQRLATSVDLLICAAGTMRPEGFEIHLNPEQAGELATAAGVRRLVLTHLRPPIDEAAAKSRAATRFAGPIEVARRGLTLEVPS
jgi:ribonuclease BN (tRNA processing enzyme)